MIKIRVDLINWTEDADSKVAFAAQLCYASDVTKIKHNLDVFNTEKDLEDFGYLSKADDITKKEDIHKFVERLRSMGHMSPFEHVSYSFFVEGISRVTSHQLVRHRLASYSQRSQRYIKHQDFDYIIPPSLEGKTVKIDSETEQDAVDYYQNCMKEISLMYNKLNEALGDCGQLSNEEARYILPNACETKIVITMNARELMHFFNLRLCQRADWEIRGLAESMLSLVKKKTDCIFDGVGPKCVQLRKCPEGKLTCGKFAEMMEKYKQ